MKKSVSLLLAILLLAGLATTALGEASFYHEASGITISIPDGFLAEDMSSEDSTALLIVDENEENLAYVYEVYYEETLESQWLENMTEEQLHAVAELFATSFGEISYTTVDVEGIHYLVMNNTDNTFGGVLSILNGWICMLYALVEDGYVMTDAVWDDLDMLQMGITYEA